jgi:hypothetical protein
LLESVFDLWARVDPRAQRVEIALSADPVQAGFEAAAIAPIGPLDAQRLLELDDATERLARLRDCLQAETEMLEFRLGEPS